MAQVTAYAMNPRKRHHHGGADPMTAKGHKKSGKKGKRGRRRHKRNPGMSTALKVVGVAVLAGGAVTAVALGASHFSLSPAKTAAAMAAGALVVGGGLAVLGEPEAATVAAGLFGAGAATQAAEAIGQANVATTSTTTQGLVRARMAQGLVQPRFS